MGIITRTITKGFRFCFFRNQPVHNFYGHLQAVMKNIDLSGNLEHLFARPFFSGGDISAANEIEWMTDLPGEPVRFRDLSPTQQKEIGTILAHAFEKIRSYVESHKDKTGIEKDYADFLQTIIVSPDSNQIFVVQNRPVIVHWGFIPDNASGISEKMFAGWDEFLFQIYRKPELNQTQTTRHQAELPPEPTSFNEKTQLYPATEPIKDNIEKSTQEKKEPTPVIACGLGDYEWVKWLAIVLAIVIILLLLLRFIPAHNQYYQQSPSLVTPITPSNGGGGGGDGGNEAGIGVGGSGGGGAGKISHFGSSTGDNTGSVEGGKLPNMTSNVVKPDSSSDDKSATSSRGSSSDNIPKNTYAEQEGRGAPVERLENIPIKCPSCGYHFVSNPDDTDKQTVSKNKDFSSNTDNRRSDEEGFGVGIKISGKHDQILVSKPPDPKTQWKILNTNGDLLKTNEAFFDNTPGKITAQGESVTLSIRPISAKNFECIVVAENLYGQKTKYRFLGK